jgi:hypothetical protein
MNLSIGGRYCSMMTVLSGNAFVLERMIGRMDTAVRMVSVIPERHHKTNPPSMPELPRVLRSAHSQARFLPSLQ